MWSWPHLWPLCGHGCLFLWVSGLRTQGAKMWADRSSCSGGRGARQVPWDAAKPLRVCAAVLAAATLAACARSSVVNNRSAALAVNRQVASYQTAPEIRPAQPTRTASSIIHRRAAVAKHHATPTLLAKHHATPMPLAKPPGEGDEATHGVASYYNQGIQTANGEKFDPSELTAAHRTLPFGRRLRVTNVATGQSVTVRINDRGPFIVGRDVDLSQGAAETLGIVHRGVAKVKLDVVE